MQHATVLDAVPAMPNLIYGTAWKKDETQQWVETAFKKGFRGFDTACQPRHYYEPGVGKALAPYFAEGVARSSVYIQSKFTPVNGQDLHSIPYDPESPIPEQIATSLECSLKNLKVDYLDGYILHSPLQPFADLLSAWRTFEAFQQQKTVLRIGISNCYDLGLLKQLYDVAEVKPSIVQNRFYAATGFDQDIREFCRDHDITYQSFWTLTANPQLLESPAVFNIARKLRKTPAQVLFRYLQQNQVVPLTGTMDPHHMQEDMEACEFNLSADALTAITRLLTS